ncbi:MAG: hypothetical protein LCI02_16000 [Proteobacteria bacterium]|nr:hypothetical protein [Pseudomonadota bacterium]
MRGVAGNARLVWRGRTLNADGLVVIGATRHLLRIEAGRVVACTREIPLLAATRFTIRGSAAAWSALWQPLPAPGWHDLLALTKRGEMAIEGDTQPVMAHLQYLKDLLALPRAGAADGR